MLDVNGFDTADPSRRSTVLGCCLCYVVSDYVYVLLLPDDARMLYVGHSQIPACIGHSTCLTY